MADEPVDSRSSVRVLTLKAEGERGIEALSKEPEDEFFSQLGCIAPPFNPESLTNWYEDSNSLQQNVSSYAVNIDGFGYILDPIVDFDSEAGRTAIEADMERNGQEVTEEELDAAIKKLKKEAEDERIRLKNFLDYIAIGISFTTLRKRTRIDLEVTGNAYWEVIRDSKGRIAKIVQVPSHMMRLLPLDQKSIAVAEKQRVGVIDWETATIARRFRRYIQKLDSGMDAVYFKEFGDPRIVSSRKGTTYSNVEEMNESENTTNIGVKPATEIIHFKIHSPSTPYGVPRWVGNLPSVLGSRYMEEVNLAYFKNKGVPPLAILVSGGTMTSEAIDRIEDVLKNEIQGRGNFHRPWVIEATTEDGSNVAPRLELKPLMSAVLSDAVFQSYDERNIDKVGSAFRVPRLLRGDVRDFNKSTSWASIRFAEEQVFGGEREEFDFIFNRTIFTDIGVKHWRFKSQGPTIRDPETIVEMLTSLAKVAALAPNEVRRVTAKALNIDLPMILEEWAQRPPSFTLAGRGFTPAGINSREVAEAEEGKIGELEAALSDIQTKIANMRARTEEERESKEAAAFKQFIEEQVELDQDLIDVSAQGQRRNEDAAGRDRTEDSKAAE